MTTQAQIRRAFWENYPDLEAIARKRGTISKGQSAQQCDTRMAFCDFVDSLADNGQISAKLAQRTTL
jgi:hypothetical protein